MPNYLSAAIAQLRQQIQKYESMLSEQRSPREYSALSREIDLLRRQVDDTEARLGRAASVVNALVNAVDGDAEVEKADFYLMEMYRAGVQEGYDSASREKTKRKKPVGKKQIKKEQDK